MNVKTLLSEEIKSEFEELKNTQLGTDEYKTTVDGITKLTDRFIELEKLEADVAEKKNARLSDLELKQEQLQEEKKDRWIKNGIAVAGIVIPSVITIWGTVKSFQFEKDGTITTIMGRGFINKLLPKK